MPTTSWGPIVSLKVDKRSSGDFVIATHHKANKAPVTFEMPLHDENALRSLAQLQLLRDAVAHSLQAKVNYANEGPNKKTVKYVMIKP